MSLIFKLEARDFTGLGGPMGSERTPTIFECYFKDVDRAKQYAEVDYGRRLKGRKADKIKWKKNGKGWSSGDLSFIGYYITQEKVQE